MNKIVCDLCGTTYSDTATQCPICGTARPTDVAPAAQQDTEIPTAASYTHVKGGRFSKKNVKKRTDPAKAVSSYRDVEEERPKRQAASARTESVQRAEPVQKTKQKEKDKVSVGLTVVAIILVVAIIAVLGYIVVRFFLPTDFFGGSKAPEVTEPVSTTEPTPQLIGCEEISFSENVLSFTELNTTQKLNVTLTPANTTDAVRFSSSDETVATVAEDGTVTVLNEGTAIITAYCGSASTQCTISCTVKPAVVLELNSKEITFEVADQTWKLYDGELDVTAITWTSDNEAVAKVADGVVTAVANGDANITAVYEDQTATCVVHCVFKEPEATEPPVDNNTYKLVNGYGGSNRDVTMSKGGSFPLKLVDQDGKVVTDATWTVQNKNVCTYSDGWVKARATGTTKVIATYNDKTYTCVIRVS